MRDLFYCKREKLLFWIAGYCDNTYNVKSTISMLQNNYNHFLKVAGEKQISSRYIEKSSRYKSMRVFYCNTDKMPENAFLIDDKDSYWTMEKWIEN